MARIRLMTSIKAVLRILKSVGTLILLIPDMHKIASSHVNENISNFIEGRKKRFDKFSLLGHPESHYLNIMWHQGGEHNNLFDYRLLKCICEESGFINLSEITKKYLTATFPEILSRHDSEHAVVIQALKSMQMQISV